MNKPLDLIDTLNDVRAQLTDERKTLMARVSLIDQALGMTGLAKPPKSPKATGAEPKTASIGDAVTGVLANQPGLTIKQIQEALPEHPPKSVEATVRSMAAAGKLTKDDQTPRHFSLPA